MPCSSKNKQCRGAHRASLESKMSASIRETARSAQAAPRVRRALSLDAVTAPSAWRGRFARVKSSRLVRQNAVLFAGGLVAGVGGFVYHAIAARALGPALYGEVASLVAIYAIGTAGAYIIILILARYAAQLRLGDNAGGIRYLVTRGSFVLIPP